MSTPVNRYEPSIALSLCIALVGCGMGKVETEARFTFPDSSASLVVEREGYGGGPGSYYKKVFVENVQTREQIISARTLHPIIVTIGDRGQSVNVLICKGTIFKATSSTSVPYGELMPVRINAKAVSEC